MAVHYSKNVKATIGTDTILWVTALSLTGIGKEFESLKFFGEDYYSSFDVGYAPLTGSMTFVMDLADTTGQNVVEDATVSGTLIQNFRVYVSDVAFWTTNSGADADAGVHFTNYSPLPATGETIKASVDFEFVGAYHRTS